jgi:hypothetical protein
MVRRCWEQFCELIEPPRFISFRESQRHTGIAPCQRGKQKGDPGALHFSNYATYAPSWRRCEHFDNALGFDRALEAAFHPPNQNHELALVCTRRPSRKKTKRYSHAAR